MLVVFRGLPGTGKTHLVRRLVRAAPDLLVLSRDGIRASLISRPTFADDEKALVDDMILTMAAFLLDSPALRVEMKKAALVRIDCDRFGPKAAGVLKWMLTPGVCLE